MGIYGAAGDFPHRAESVARWLDAIKMAQWKPAFEGMSVDELLALKETRLQELVPFDGHRKRIMLAMRSLGASVRIAPQQKFNSTGSMFMESTITRPCTDEIIFCVAIVMHDRIEDGEQALKGPSGMSQSQGMALAMFDTTNKPLFPQEDENEDGTLVPVQPGEAPKEDTIYHTIKSIYSIAEFSPECLVISLLYIERVRQLSKLELDLSNWQPVLLAAMIVAQKVWDDKSLLTVDFSAICEAYSDGPCLWTVKDINVLELKFLELVEYNLSITSSLYASYYFELRTLCQKADRDFALKPLTESELKKLESTSVQKTERLREKRRAGSDGNISFGSSASGSRRSSHSSLTSLSTSSPPP